MKQLGNRLRTLRESIGISRAKFAVVIGSTLWRCVLIPLLR